MKEDEKRFFDLAMIGAAEKIMESVPNLHLLVPTRYIAEESAKIATAMLEEREKAMRQILAAR